MSSGSGKGEQTPRPAYPLPSSPAVSAVMRANHRRDTRPEIRLRSLLHATGLRFRRDFPIRTPERLVRVDVAFVGRRVAVLVDGCFWHRCPAHGTAPRANSSYWKQKLDGNVARDREVDRCLQAAGWTVLRVWEHEDPEEAAAGIARVVRAC
jgi:DNA mismatch endonuclease (patch repair protein)